MIATLFSLKAMQADALVAVWRSASAVTRVQWQQCGPQRQWSLMRAADGHCSAIFSRDNILLCDKGRVCGSRTTCAVNYFINAVTGAVLSRTAINNPAVDTSGALVWSGNDTLMASSYSGCDWRELDVKGSDGGFCFRYGICVIPSGDDYHVLRFDGEPAPNREPECEASAVQARAMRHCD